jgi:hypothetical protein
MMDSMSTLVSWPKNGQADHVANHLEEYFKAREITIVVQLHPQMKLLFEQHVYRKQIHKIMRYFKYAKLD